jgi:hypothetical protein
VGLGAPGMHWTLTLHVPEEFSWDQDRHAPQNVAVVANEQHILRVRLHFAQAEHVPWSFAFRARRSL